MHIRLFYRKRGSASYIVREVLLVRERERDTEREREIDGSDVTIVALKLAMNLHFPLPKNFRPQALFPLFQMARAAQRLAPPTSDRKPKTNDQILPSAILFFPSKN